MRNKYQLLFCVFFITIFLVGCGETASGKTASLLAGKDSEITAKEPIKVRTKPLDVPLINQMDEPRLYNGCEVSSLAMLLNYHGYETTKNSLAEKMARVPLTYENGLKGNPNDGFVGDLEDGPGLTVYHGPVFDMAKQYAGDKAEDITGESIDTLYDYLAQGQPIWVITTVNFAPVDDFETWETPSGIMKVSYSVHSVVVTGFDDNHVYLNNPYGEKNQKVNKENFEAAWEQMGSQAIVIKN